MNGEAADISVGNPTENKKLFDMIVASDIVYD
jgi:predicted nicotinamide N-methyase